MVLIRYWGSSGDCLVILRGNFLLYVSSIYICSSSYPYINTNKFLEEKFKVNDIAPEDYGSFV
jgi:hypothetical protein